MQHTVYTHGTQGFTLIELLIVIAIIGILAAVFIPNLLGARQSATERTAQVFSSNVTKTSMAYLASSNDKQPSDLPTDCTAAATLSSSDGVEYGWSDKPASVTGCTITPNDAAGLITVVVQSQSGKTYTNGFVD